jgi:threonylcarbamoyladenosine tRNA methylthiotransferase MtaB
MQLKFNIQTFGCKLNIYESESISQILQKNGIIQIDDYSKSDVVIINTCTVTTKSDAKCRNAIRKIKKVNPISIIIVCGCLVNTNLDELMQMNEVDVFIENKNKDKIMESLDLLMENKNIPRPFIFKSNKDGSFNFQTSVMNEHSRAFVKIQDGCDNYCSYCKIPFARGNSRSREVDSIIKEIDQIAENNYEEVVLTGINIGSFNYNECNFGKLLFLLTNRYKKIRFRIGSIEPQYVNDEFLNVFSSHNICSHAHIPLQSGSDKILKLMNRKYDLKYFENIIEKTKKIKKGLFLSTDLILGFPDESDSDFNDTLTFVKKTDFSFIHLFGYSPREGTKAFLMKPKIPERIRDERVNIIKNIVEESNLKYRNTFLNKNLETIIERKKGKYYTGKSDNYIDMTIDSTKELLPKKKYNIYFSKIENNTNYGTVIS